MCNAGARSTPSGRCEAPRSASARPRRDASADRCTACRWRSRTSSTSRACRRGPTAARALQRRRRQRRRDRAGAQDRRRDRAGQGAHHGVRLLRSLAGAQSPQPRAHARRLELRIGGGGGRRHGADGGGHADGRLGQPAGGLLRHCRLQAEHAQPADVRHHAAGPVLRYARLLRLERRRRGLPSTRRSRRPSCDPEARSTQPQRSLSAFPTTRTSRTLFPKSRPRSAGSRTPSPEPDTRSSGPSRRSRSSGCSDSSARPWPTRPAAP